MSKSTAQCLLCTKQISWKESNATGLDRHLRIVPNMSVNQPLLYSENQSEITAYVARKSLSETISHLAAEDGLTRLITKSKFIP